MRERLAGCLEKGGRSFQQAHKTPFHSRRHLHFAFWSHGAGNINLPAWWILLLQNTQSECRERFSRTKDAVSKPLDLGLSGLFFGFLYPIRTRALIKKINRLAVEHREAAQLAQQRSRRFTSLATDLITGTPKVATSAESEADAEVGGGIPAYEGLALKPSDPLYPLQDISDFGHTKSRDELWEAYQVLLKESCRPDMEVLHTMLQRMSTSTDEDDLRRSLLLLEIIGQTERTEWYYDKGIRISIRLQDLSVGMNFMNEALQAFPNSMKEVGTPRLFKAAIRQKDWQIAIDIWHRFWQSPLLYHTTAKDLWSQAQDHVSVTDMVNYATDATEFALSAADSLSVQTGKAAREFAIVMAERAIRTDQVARSPDGYLHLIDKLSELLGSDRKSIVEDTFYQLQLVGDPEYDRAAINVYENLRTIQSFRQSPLILTVLLKMAYQLQSASLCVMLLEDYRRNDLKLPMLGYALMAETLAHLGETNAMQVLLQEFISHYGSSSGSYFKLQSQKIFNFMIFVHFKRGDVRSALQAFKELQTNYNFTPNTRSYNFVLMAFAQDADFESALEWFHKLKESHCTPDIISFATIMSMFAHQGDVDATLSFMNDFEAQGLKLDTPIIDAMVTAYVSNNQCEEAEKIVIDASRMELSGSRTYMWNTLLDGFAAKKNLAKIHALYEQMRASNVTPDQATFSAICLAFCNARQTELAANIIRKVLPRLGIQRTALHYALVMRADMARKKYERVEMLYKEMLANKVLPDGNVYNMLLRAAAKLDELAKDEEGSQLRRARQVFESMMKTLNPKVFASDTPRIFLDGYTPPEAFFSLPHEYMISLYGSSGAFEAVTEIFDQWLETGRQFGFQDLRSRPPWRILTSLMATYRRAEDHNAMTRCWSLVTDSLQESCCRNGADTTQDSWVLSARRFDVNPPFMQYMAYLIEQNRVNDLIELVNDLRRAGYELTNQSWNAYIQFLAASATPNHQYLAFELCETELMPTWPGWGDLMSHPYRTKQLIGRMQLNAFLIKTLRSPTYETLIRMAAVYIDSQSGDVVARQELSRKQLIRIAPSTVKAVQGLPRIDDETQSVLR